MGGKPYYRSDAPGYALVDYRSVKRDFDNNSGSYKQGPPKKEGCFVAGVIYAGMASSAAYCEEEVEQVRVLREYRDNVLMQSESGREFVKWYYGGAGKRIANFIEEKGRFLIPIIRKGLDFIVEDYKQRRI